MKTTNRAQQKILANSVIAISCLSVVFGLAGCQKEPGTAEKTGKKIDLSVQQANKKVDQTATNAKQNIGGAKEAVSDKAATAETYLDDTVITSKVKAAILDDAMLNGSNIEVSTNQGVVSLSGTVGSEPLIGRALAAANNQKGVKSVQNNLAVVIAATTGKKD